MGRITGTGCQLSGLMTAYITANPEHQLEAAAAAVCVRWDLPVRLDGATCRKVTVILPIRNRIIDAIYNMTKEQLDEGAKYEVR